MKYDIIIGLTNKTRAGFQKIEKNLEGLEKKSNRLKANLAKLAGPARLAAAGIAVLAAAATAAAAAIGALAIKNISAITSMSNQADIAGVSASEFQKLAFAANKVGIEQDKLSDIFKDVNDKVGDFLTTGAGPMADFFEQIAPKVGVTADEFRRLSGPAALQLYVDSLEAANVNQAQMTFYMEAIASDATALIPLLKDGGAGFAKWAEEAEKAGLILDDLSVRKVVDAKSSFTTLGQVMSSVVDQISAGIAPGLQAIAEYLTEIAIDNLPNIQAMAAEAFNSMIKGIGWIIDGVSLLINSFKVLIGIADLLKNAFITGFGAIARVVQGVLNGIIDGINLVKETINDLTSFAIKNPITGKVIYEVEGTGFEETGKFTFGTDILEAGLSGQEEAVKNIAAAYEKIEAVLSGGGAGAEFAKNTLERIDAINDEAEAAQIAADAMKALGINSEGTERITKTLADTLGKSVPAAVKELTPAMEEAKKKFQELQGQIKGLGDKLTTDLANALRTGQGLWESFGNFFSGLLDMILQKILEIIIVKPLMDALFGSLGGFGGSGSGSIGGLILGGLGIPMFAEGGHLQAGKLGIVGEAGPELVRGPADIYSNADSTRMMSGGGSSIISPVFNTTINPSEDTSPEAAREFANQFNKAIEAKVTDTIIRIQNRGGGRLQQARSY